MIYSYTCKYVLNYQFANELKYDDPWWLVMIYDKHDYIYVYLFHMMFDLASNETWGGD